MRIAVVHSRYTAAQPSGENVVVDAQVGALRRAGHEVRAVVRETDVEAHSRLYPIRAAAAAAQLAGPSPAAELEAFRPDVVHVHNLFPNWGTGWLRAWGPRTVATLHNVRYACAAATFFRDGHECRLCPEHGSHHALVHRCYRGSPVATLPLAVATRGGGSHDAVMRHAARLLVLNELARGNAERVARGAVAVLPNFAPPLPGAATAQPAGGERDSWVYVGRLTPEKGVLWLAENLPAGAQLDVVGDGPQLAEVEAAAAASGGRVRVHPGLARDGVARLVRAAHGLVLPSMWQEGLPTVLLEALASGTPVLVSSICVSAGEVTRDGAGVVFDPAAGAPGLERAMAEVVARGEAGRAAALRRHEAAYSEAAWVAGVEAHYREVVAAAPGRPAR